MTDTMPRYDVYATRSCGEGFLLLGLRNPTHDVYATRSCGEGFLLLGLRNPMRQFGFPTYPVARRAVTGSVGRTIDEHRWARVGDVYVRTTCTYVTYEMGRRKVAERYDGVYRVAAPWEDPEHELIDTTGLMRLRRIGENE